MRRQSLKYASAKSVRMPRSAWSRSEASINVLTKGLEPEGPTYKLCRSEEPKEAMAARGPDGRMVPTSPWRTDTPMNRDAMDLLSNRIL